MKCKRRYKYENIDKLGRISGDKADLGSAAHVFQEVMFTDGIEAANAAARAMVPLSQSEEWINAKKIIESIVIKKDFLYSAEARWHWEFPAIKDMPDANTQRANELGISSSEIYTIQVEAKIDQLFVYHEDHIMEIIDGKSGRQVPNETELKSDAQGKLYAVVVLENLKELGFKKILFSQAQWKFGRLLTAEYNIEELEEFKQQIMAIGQQMLNEEKFEPSPDTHCHWCPFVLNCDAAQRMLPKTVEIAGLELPPVITNDNEAERIGKGVLHLEAIAKRYRAAIKGYAKETGQTVKVNEGGWDFWTRKTLKIADLKKLLEVAEQEGIDIAPYLSYNNKAGKTLAKKNPILLDDGLVEQQYPFFSHKAKLGDDDYDDE